MRIIGQMTYLPGLRGLRLLRAAEPVITCISKHRRASYFRQAHRGDDGLLPRFPRRVFSGCSGRMPGVIGQSEDAFGAALVDYLEGRDVPGLVLEVEGDRAGPAMHPEWFFRGVERWEWWDQQLLPLIGQGPVLDLGAGAGRASLYLQERGLAVTAVDASPGAVEVCRRRGGADARLGDVNDPPADQRWAGVLLLYGNLGLGGSWESPPGALLFPQVSCFASHIRVRPCQRARDWSW